ncbi:MAG: ComEC/Rec2 family competence protein [bacterium]
MKISLVSKIEKFAFSTYFLLFFALGILAGIKVNSLILIYLIVLFLAASFLMILTRLKSAGFLIFFSLGILIGLYSQIQISKDFQSVCTVSTVTSRAKKYKRGFLYKVKSPEILIFSPDDEAGIADEISFCMGDKVELEGSDRNYILSQLGRSAVFEGKNIKIEKTGHGLKRSINNLSVKFKGASYTLFSGDSGVLAYGLIFGSSGDFSRQFKADLKSSGTSHLVAVSGYNVSIITSWLFGALRYIGKNFAGVFSVFILLIFYLLTGGSASVLRASIMGVVILVSKFIGRKVSGEHLLLLAGCLILAFNPFAIYDWGFQLSFAATFGLFFLAEPLFKLFSLKIKFLPGMVKIFTQTLSAQIFVLPLLVGSFGSFSLIAPLANILILPLIPFLMGLIFISFVTYFTWGALGIFLAGMTKALLYYVIAVIELSAKLPFASMELSLKPFFVFIFYIIIIVLTGLIRRKAGKLESG